MQAFDVFLNGQCIDTVYYNADMSASEVKWSLIGHDGYSPNIKVYKVIKLQKRDK